jgi:hypothetical protein
MKAIPILFTGPMVRAILDGRKTQTRRIVKPQPKPLPDIGEADWIDYDQNNGVWLAGVKAGAVPEFGEWNSRYVPRDLLWVKENAWMWCKRIKNGLTKTGRQRFRYIPFGEAIRYKIDCPDKPTDLINKEPDYLWRMKVARYMPHWASRISLRVTGIRVERLQDISEADAIAEGIFSKTGSMFGTCYLDYYYKKIEDAAYVLDPIESYRSLWEKINGPGSWDANPFVWVVKFERTR